MRRILIGIVLCLVLLAESRVAQAACVSPPPPCPAGTVCANDFVCRNDWPDPRLAFRIFVPAACTGDARCPLLIFLHGLGETGTDNSAQLNNNANGALQIVQPARQAIQPMIMVAPQCCHEEGGQWGGQKDRLINMLEQIEGEFPYDARRIYLTGLSMGGGGLLDWIGTYHKLFAAIAPLAPHTGYTAGDANWANTSAWFFHAANDGTATVDNSRNHVAALRAGGGDPLYTEYASGGHGIWVQSYASEHLFRWMIAQRLGSSQTLIDPSLRITSPTEGPVWTTGASSLNLAGSATTGVGSIVWSSGANTGNVSGTANWSVTGVPLVEGSQRIRVQGRGASEYASLGGWTEVSGGVQVIVPGVANTAPRVLIVSPPIARAGDRIELYAHPFDDGLPVPGALDVTWAVDAAPTGAVLTVDPLDPLDPRHAYIDSAAIGAYRIRATASDGALQGDFVQQLRVFPQNTPLSIAIAINSGGEAYAASDGTQYLVDQYFTAGSGASTASGASAIHGTPDDVLYQSYRVNYGSWGYDIPLANGDYFVILHFAETYNPSSVEGARISEIKLQNQTVLSRFSAYSLVGQRAALRYGFAATVANGMLTLRAERTNGQGERGRIDAIQILRLDPIFANGFE
jgi:poly(3-hydroxybutyrate) depolymerase